MGKTLNFPRQSQTSISNFFPFNSYAAYVVAGSSDAITLDGLFPDTQYMLTVSAIWSTGRKYRSRAIVFRTLGDSEGFPIKLFICILSYRRKTFPDTSLLPKSSPQQDMPIDNNTTRLLPPLNSHSKESNNSSNVIRELPTVNF